MADVVSPETRSRMMSGIRAKNSVPEMKVRKSLHARGFRFRLHCRELPGKPDIVFRSIVPLFLYMDVSGMPTSALCSNGRKQGRISGKRRSATTESVTLLSWMNLHDKAGEF